MSKLDWSRVDDHSSDPARQLRDRSDVNLVNTPAARTEAQRAAKARSKAAKAAAQTRKIARQREQEADRKAIADKQLADRRADVFWAELQASMAAANEKRRKKGAQVL